MQRCAYGALLVLFSLATEQLAAQTAAVRSAAATITDQDVAKRVGIMAHDSMGGRDTPSRGLELTARYVAQEFESFGLKPGGDNGTWSQSYPVQGRRTVDMSNSRVVIAVRGQEVVARFDTYARLSQQILPEENVSGSVVLVAGPHSVESITKASLRDKIVMYVAPEGIDSTLHQQVLRQLLLTSTNLLILSPMDSAAFAARQKIAVQQNLVTTVPYWAVTVWPGAVRAVLATAGVDVARLRAEKTQFVQEFPEVTVRLETKSETINSVNVVAILEGSDATLKHEYVVFSAHMDHIGKRSGQPDSIYNGADDNASGTAGILELAQAFTRRGARPRRSIIFLTVSGEEKGLLGSAHFVAQPPVPLDQIVANVNFDMIGRNAADSVLVIGQEHSDLGSTLKQVAAAHSELSMNLGPGPEQFYTRSDHYSFARRGVPVLFFFTGTHADYHRVTDSVEKIDAKKAARLLRLAFYLGHAVGNSNQRPQWDEASYRKITTQQR
jgi:peptidase M28-like protein